jgi:hypothetical protein
MSSFYDRIYPYACDPRLVTPVENGGLYKWFPECICIKVYGIHEFGVNQEKSLKNPSPQNRMKYFKGFCIRPPFDSIFLEWKYVTDTDYDIYGGCMVKYLAPDDKKYVAFDFIFMKDIHPYWVTSLATTLFVEIDNEGHIIDGSYYHKHHNGDTDRKPNRLTEDSYLIALSALGLINTKNVEMLAHEPPEKVNRKRIKSGKHPYTRFYTLKINPINKHKIAETNFHENQGLMSLHLCRGHFKNYDEKPLFGKYRGTYWWSPIVRGNKENGVIVKDYELVTQ